MINLQNKILYILLFAILSACTQKVPAPVTIRSDAIYDRGNSYNENKYKRKNVVKSNYLQPEVAKVKHMIVSAGDSVYSISQKYQVSMRDLIDKNNFKPPYNLRIGEKIELPTEKYHNVQSGDTLYGISRTYGMNVNNLISMNGLLEPYTVKIGDRLKINSTSSYASGSQVQVKDANKVWGNKKTASKKDSEFIWPVNGPVISKFGSKPGGLYNDGINIKAQDGAEVRAVEDGEVAYVGNELRGYGNLIIVKHSDGWISAYAHLSDSNVKRGDMVKKGDAIAKVGSTGNVETSQLYFGIRKGREAVNPETYLHS